MPTDSSPAPSTAAPRVVPLDVLQRYLVGRLVFSRDHAEAARIRALRWRKDAAATHAKATRDMYLAWAFELEREAAAHSADAAKLMAELTGSES